MELLMQTDSQFQDGLATLELTSRIRLLDDTGNWLAVCILVRILLPDQDTSSCQDTRIHFPGHNVFSRYPCLAASNLYPDFRCILEVWISCNCFAETFFQYRFLCQDRSFSSRIRCFARMPGYLALPGCQYMVSAQVPGYYFLPGETNLNLGPACQDTDVCQDARIHFSARIPR